MYDGIEVSLKSMFLVVLFLCLVFYFFLVYMCLCWSMKVGSEMLWGFFWWGWGGCEVWGCLWLGICSLGFGVWVWFIGMVWMGFLFWLLFFVCWCLSLLSLILWGVNS